jgi:hypothetical protein
MSSYLNEQNLSNADRQPRSAYSSTIPAPSAGPFSTAREDALATEMNTRYLLFLMKKTVASRRAVEEIIGDGQDCNNKKRERAPTYCTATPSSVSDDSSHSSSTTSTPTTIITITTNSSDFSCKEKKRMKTMTATTFDPSSPRVSSDSHYQHDSNTVFLSSSDDESSDESDPKSATVEIAINAEGDLEYPTLNLSEDLHWSLFDKKLL